MSILKISKSAEDKSPGAVDKGKKEQGVEPSSQSLVKRKIKKEYYPLFWASVTFFAATLVVLGYFTFRVTEHSSSSDSLANVYFELKVINEKGHPMPAVKVYKGRKKVGMTDTFGEWKAYKEFSAGKSFSLKFIKRSGKQLYFATKNFVIPKVLPQSKEVEFKGSVVIHQKVKGQKRRQNKSDWLAKTKASRPKTKGANNSEILVVNLDQESQGMSQVATSEKREHIWFHVLHVANKTPDFTHKQGVLRKYLIPALQHMGQDQGLQMNRSSRRKVSLVHVPSADPQQKGVIKVAVNASQNQNAFEFITNYTGHAGSTAQNILAALKTHLHRKYRVRRVGSHWVVKQPIYKFRQLSKFDHLYNSGRIRASIPADVEAGQNIVLANAKVQLCGNKKIQSCFLSNVVVEHGIPSKAWQESKIKLMGGKVKLAKVYVAGVQAHYLGKNTWRYRVKQGGRANLTIIKNGVVIYRKPLNSSKPVISSVVKQHSKSL